jgi:hypothetical protein
MYEHHYRGVTLQTWITLTKTSVLQLVGNNESNYHQPKRVNRGFENFHIARNTLYCYLHSNEN